MRRTKIVCTMGPACADEVILQKMMDAGMNVARLNFSHGDHDAHARQISLVRRVAAQQGANVAILQDLQGPRLRTGKLVVEPVELAVGASFTITSRPVEGTAEAINVEGVDLAHEVAPGNSILIEDGLLELTVVSTTDTDVVCRVVTGGPLRSRKGINVPGVTLTVPSITDKDRADLAFGIRQGVDFIAMSFVRSAGDVEELRRLVRELGGDQPIIAKIEKHEAVAAFDAILEAADGVMVARGDLGVETSAEDVPIIQKMAIAKCNAAGKPVITATQMLNSMIQNPRPTRAEASDVANAIFDGTDAVMLSGETSIGQYPVVAVRTMSRIAEKAEQSLPYRELPDRQFGSGPDEVANAIGQATARVAREIAAKAIITMTASGYTARMVARHRPPERILGITNRESTCRRLALSWGVEGTLASHYESVEGLFATADRVVIEVGCADNGDQVVITAGMPIGFGGRTNLLNVHTIGDRVAGKP